MMVSGTFSQLLAPGLNKVFHTAYNEAPSVWESVFNLDSSQRAYEEDLSWAGFEQFQNYGELEDIELRDANEGYKTRYVHRKWGLGYQLSRELVDDNLYSGTIDQFPAMLARAARATKETVAASIFNLGFTGGPTGGDGETLFSTGHPFAGAAGGTGANTFSTARELSHSALKEALTALKRTRADDNIFSPIIPRVLLVPDALEHRANEILQTQQVPYSADNTINVLTRQGLQVVAWSYLTDDDNWFLLAPKENTLLRYFERWPMRQVMKDREENQSMLHLAYERYSLGWSDWRGTWGVEGS
jgi:phage major head subunit gpT-like protein